MQGFKPPLRQRHVGLEHLTAWHHGPVSLCPLALWREAVLIHQHQEILVSAVSSRKFLFEVTLSPLPPPYVLSRSRFLFCDRSLYKVDLKLQAISGILFWRRGVGITLVMGSSLYLGLKSCTWHNGKCLGGRVSISAETEHLLQTTIQLVHCSVL